MKLSVRILLSLACVLMVLALPFVLSSPNMLGEVQWHLLDEMEGEAAGFASWLFPAAHAEDGEYALPLDFTPGKVPLAAGYTQAGYEDDSIRVQMETREENGVIWRIAWVEISSPSQLRTATAGKKLTSKTTATVAAMAQKNNAVVAINGDNFVDNPTKTSYEYRMGQKIRNKTNRLKDILIIDEKGDFHTFINSQGIKEFEEGEGEIINAFTFGPALVQQGNLLTISKDYGYNPKGREPRAAIGQLDTLSYVLVVAEGRGDSVGATQQELADFMYSLGCQEAYNLDGGGTAAMVYQNKYYNDLAGNERSISDIIYFASGVEGE